MSGATVALLEASEAGDEGLSEWLAVSVVGIVDAGSVTLSARSAIDFGSADESCLLCASAEPFMGFATDWGSWGSLDWTDRELLIISPEFTLLR